MPFLNGIFSVSFICGLNGSLSLAFWLFSVSVTSVLDFLVFLSCWFYDTDLITRMFYMIVYRLVVPEPSIRRSFFGTIHFIEKLIKWGWLHQNKLWKTVLSSFDKYSRTKQAKRTIHFKSILISALKRHRVS